MLRIDAGIRSSTFLVVLAALSAWSCSQSPTGPDQQGETVQLNVKQLSLLSGDSAQLTATVRMKGKAVGGASLSWSSTDQSVVRVNGNGKVKAVGSGTSKVVAKSGSGSDTATVVVDLGRIELAPTTYDFGAIGQTEQITAQAYDVAGNPMSGVGLEWSTTNASIASVDSMGKVTSKGAGTATIVAAAVCCTVSASATVTVPQGQSSLSPGEAWFSDSFETGDRSHTENGFSWGGGMPVSTDYAHSGTHSLKFAYPATAWGKDSSEEQRFVIAADAASAPSTIWIEYWVRVPENFKQRDDKPNNNKLISLWAENYDNSAGDAEATFEYYAPSGTTKPRESVAAGDDYRAGIYPRDRRTVQEPIFTDVEKGKWVQVRILARVATTGIVSRIWFDGRLVYEVRDLNTVTTGGLNYYRHGYLFGWANSGFDEPTTFYVDDFRVYTSDPGW